MYCIYMFLISIFSKLAEKIRLQLLLKLLLAYKLTHF